MDNSFDEVERPAHYCYSRIQPLEIIEEWNLPFHLACALKYLARFRHKGQPIQDLRKAVFYLQRYIGLLEKETRPIGEPDVGGDDSIEPIE